MIEAICHWGDSIYYGITCQLDVGVWPIIGLDLLWWWRK